MANKKQDETRVTPDDIREFQEALAAFEERSRSVIGEIIHYHLVVEHFVSRCFSASYPDGAADDIRLTFYQKAQMLPITCYGFTWVKESVLDINRLRNAAAHRADFSLADWDLSKLRQSVQFFSYGTGKPMPDGIELVREAAWQAGLALHGWTKMILRASRHGVGVLLEREELALRRAFGGSQEADDGVA